MPFCWPTVGDYWQVDCFILLSLYMWTRSFHNHVLNFLLHQHRSQSWHWQCLVSMSSALSLPNISAVSVMTDLVYMLLVLLPIFLNDAGDNWWPSGSRITAPLVADYNCSNLHTLIALEPSIPTLLMQHVSTWFVSEQIMRYGSAGGLTYHQIIPGFSAAAVTGCLWRLITWFLFLCRHLTRC